MICQHTVKSYNKSTTSLINRLSSLVRIVKLGSKCSVSKADSNNSNLNHQTVEEAEVVTTELAVSKETRALIRDKFLLVILLVLICQTAAVIRRWVLEILLEEIPHKVLKTLTRLVRELTVVATHHQPTWIILQLPFVCVMFSTSYPVVRLHSRL
jgi:dolichol kinase